jgi:hypothetical protein
VSTRIPRLRAGIARAAAFISRKNSLDPHQHSPPLPARQDRPNLRFQVGQRHLAADQIETTGFPFPGQTRPECPAELFERLGRFYGRSVARSMPGKMIQ